MGNFDIEGNVRVVGQLACVVFDEDDGTVVHAHGAICLEGGEMPDEVALLERAVELAKRSSDLGGRKLQTLMIDPAEMSGGPMRVDLATKRVSPDESQKPPNPEGFGSASAS
jgi:hypothetical protein